MIFGRDSDPTPNRIKILGTRTFSEGNVEDCTQFFGSKVKKYKWKKAHFQGNPNFQNSVTKRCCDYILSKIIEIEDNSFRVVEEERG